MTPNDVKIVADNIDDFIEVPDGVTRLRKAVLTLAVSGKLVSQDKNEGTAEELYAQIQSDQRGEIVGRKKNSNRSTPISFENLPFDIPSSWKWVCGRDLFSVVRGVTYGKQDARDEESAGYVPLLRSHNIQDTGLNTRDLVFVPEDKISSQQMLKKGDILIAMSSGSKNLVGKAAQVHENMSYSYGAFCAVIRSKLPSIAPYLGFFFSTPYYRDATALEGKGMSINNLTVGALEDLLIPLPPLMEQERIVMRSKEVVDQLGDLEIKKQERDEVRARLARSAMHSLGKGESKIAFEQLTELVKTPSDIKELENALLTLAVSGKLVPQSKADGTAENLYNQIRGDLIKAEENSTPRKKKLKDFAPIANDEISFDIPKSWRWVRIGEVGAVKGGKRLPKGSGFVEQITNHPYIRITDMKNGSVNTSGVPYISDEVFEKISRYTISSEDVYVTIAGTIGDAGKIPKELDGANLTENAAKIEFKFIDIDFLVLALRSTSVKAQFLKKVVQMAQPKLALHRIESSIIPLPPLSEQKRIAKKVEELMILINKIKELI